MSGELSLAPASIDPGTFFKPEQVDLIKRQIAKGVTDDELKLFLYQCARTGLDPFSRQIYAIVRKQWDPNANNGRGDKVPKMSIQTGIDGLRLIADRTGRYAPGPENTYEYDKDGKVTKATAYVLKRAADGTWHTVAASAHFWEYAQEYNGKLSDMWGSKPHIMIGKCAEALALRKAFPAEMSGVYTSDEMGKSDEVAVPAEYTPPAAEGRGPKEDAPAPIPGASEASRTTDGSTTAADQPKERAAKDEERTKRVKNLARLLTTAAPDGCGWSKADCEAWAQRRLGKTKPSEFTDQEIKDATLVALAFMAGGQIDQLAKEAEFVAAGRMRGDGQEKAA